MQLVNDAIVPHGRRIGKDVYHATGALIAILSESQQLARLRGVAEQEIDCHHAAAEPVQILRLISHDGNRFGGHGADPAVVLALHGCERSVLIEEEMTSPFHALTNPLRRSESAEGLLVIDESRLRLESNLAQTSDQLFGIGHGPL